MWVLRHLRVLRSPTFDDNCRVIFNKWVTFVPFFSIWPGSLLYMSTVLPVIWVAELKILNEKIAKGADNCTFEAEQSISVSGLVSNRKPVSIKRGLRTGYKTRTRYKMGTSNYELSIKHGLNKKKKTRTTGCAYKRSFRIVELRKKPEADYCSIKQ